MGYPSHSYANYLGQFESNAAYGDPVHYMHHLSAAAPTTVAAATTTTAPPPPPPAPPYANDPLHHQHMAMIHSHENRTWYQPPIAVTPQLDHRYSFISYIRNNQSPLYIVKKPRNSNDSS